MNIDLTGKVAIITGAGRGIGKVIASTFAAEGAVAVVTDIKQELLDAWGRDFAERGWKGHTYPCDVRDYAAITRIVEDVVARYGRIDILVNNAGVALMSPVSEMTEEQWDLNQDINLKGTFLMCKGVIPVMKKQRYGRILNASSFAAIVPSYGSGAYASSKAGVHYLTRTLAGELGPWDITVNCYAPGMIPTEMNHFADAAAERQEKLLDTLSLRRWGKEQEIANLLVFLASDYAAYITGAMIEASGGKLATQIPRQAYEEAAKSGEIAFP
jgi:3-oxoacyl-[acyl-carrier protein] reductase